MFDQFTLHLSEEERERESYYRALQRAMEMLIWQHLVASFIYRRAQTLYGVVTAVATNRIYTTHATDSERERKRDRASMCEREVERKTDRRITYGILRLATYIHG